MSENIIAGFPKIDLSGAVGNTTRRKSVEAALELTRAQLLSGKVPNGWLDNLSKMADKIEAALKIEDKK